MLGRDIKYIFAAIISMVLLNLAFSLPSMAALEQYAWKDYKTVEAYNGIYGVIASTGGNEETEFTQAGATSLMASSPSDSCEGSLQIDLTTNDSAGKLSASGDCSPFQDADKNIRISSQDVAIKAIEEEEAKMHEAYIKKKCTNDEDKECSEVVQAEISEKQATCLDKYNYKTNVIKGDEYLNCISMALGVDRPVDEEAAEKSDEKCTIPDTGWIICQANLFIAGITDNTFNLLKMFLVISPLEQSSSGSSSSVFEAWKVFRTFANVLLVAAFLLIIYSLLTGAGINVYNIKKMMPRLVVAALLINMSFIICAIAIDASNIVGSSVQDIIKRLDSNPRSSSGEYSSWKEVTDKVQSTSATEDPEAEAAKTEESADGEDDETATETPAADVNQTQEEKDAAELDSFNLTKLVVGGAEITGIAVMFVQLSALVPIMVMALFALATVVLVLMLRMALVIILVVIAPLAFACILLPNTKKWYDRWQSLFVTMMILFPAIALIFGASSLAASVIQASAIANGQVLLAIFSMGIQVIPLFIAPLLIKLSGGVLSQFAGIVNNRQKGLYDRSMNRAREFRSDRQAIRQMNAARGTTLFGKVPVPARLNRWRPINRKAVSSKGKEMAASEAEDRLKQFTADNSEAINNLALRGINDDVKGAIDQVLSGMATMELEDIEVGEVAAAEASFLNDKSITPDAIMNMAASGMRSGEKLSEAEHRAAVRLAGRQFNDVGDAGSDGVAKANRLVAMAHEDTGNGGMSINVRRELINTLRANKMGDKAAYLGGASLGKIERGEVYGETGPNGIDGLVVSAAKGGKFSQQAIANSSSTTVDLVNRNMADIQAANPQAAAQIKTNAANALVNPNLSTSIRQESRGHIERLSQ